MPETSSATDEWVNVVMAVIGSAFILALIVAVLIRVIVATRRSRLRELRRTVAQPFADSVAVESTAYGWRPAAEAARDTFPGEPEPP